MKRIIRLLLSIFILVGISAGVIGQTVAEEEDFLLSLLPAILTALYHRAEPDKASFADAIEIIAVETQTPLRFDFKLSAYPVGEGVKYSWAFGDQQSAVGMPVSHDYAALGTYTVALSIEIPGYARQELYKQIQVKPENLLPRAEFSASTVSGYAPLSVDFDASASSDSDGSITRYTWRFGDGSSASGRTVSHQYQSIGIYTNYVASLTVTDERGGQASASRSIGVNRADTRPVARFDMTPPEGDAPLDIRFDARASSDMDGDIVTYSWDFDDGHTAQGARVKHPYEQAGNYQPQLTVTDNTGAQHSIQRSLKIEPANLPPEATFSISASSGIAPVSLRFDASASLDADGSIVLYRWDFGDGHLAQGRQVEHRYPDAGEYIASLLVTDNEGGTTTRQQIISISGAQPAPTKLRVTTPAGTTLENPVQLQGLAVADTALRVYVNGVFQDEIPADSQGRWHYAVALLDGENQIRAEQASAEGMLSFERLIAYENRVPRDLSGMLVSDQMVLTPGNPPRPYTLDTDHLRIADSGHLIVQPGVEIEFNSGVASQVHKTTGMYVEGALSIRGSASRPVWLTTNLRDRATANDFWWGIEVSENASLIEIDHANIDLMSKNLYLTGVPIRLTNSRFSRNSIDLRDTKAASLIENSTFTGGFKGVGVAGESEAMIRGNTFVDNTVGIDLSCASRDEGTRSVCPQVEINGNNLLSHRAIRLLDDRMESDATHSGIDATGNWWGTTQIQTIGAYKVDYQDFLDGPVPGGKIFAGELFNASGAVVPIGPDTRLVAGQNYYMYATLRVPSDTSLVLETGASLILDSQYSSFFDLSIAGDLSLQAGAKIESRGRNQINIGGDFTVSGTDEQPVRFTSPPPESYLERWLGIRIAADGGQVSIDHALFEYAQTGLYIDDAGGTVKNSVFQDNWYGLYLNGRADLLVSGNTVRRNQFGITEAGSEPFPAGPQASVVANNLQDNHAGNYSLLQNDGQVAVRAMPGNWWGSTDIARIADQIYDHSDNARVPYLDFSGYLDGPLPMGQPYSQGARELLVISEDFTLNPGDDYVLLGDIYVPDGVTFTLAAGSHLRMQDAQGGAHDLIVDGRLVLEAGAAITFAGSGQKIEINGDLLISGFAADPVQIYSSRAMPSMGDWQGIHITPEAGTVSVNFAQIRHAQRGIWFDGVGGTLKNSTLEQDTLALLATGGSQPQLDTNSYVANRFDTQFFDHDIDLSATSPRARFIFVEKKDSPYSVEFDGRSSLSGGADREYPVIAYRWDFGDTGHAQGPQIEHTFPGAGTYSVSLSVLDSNGGLDTVSQEVKVLTPNVMPTAIAGHDQFLEAGANVVLDGFQSYDADGSIKHYAWRQLSGTPVTLPAPEYGRNTIVMPDMGVGQSLVFELTVTDNRGATATDTLSVTQLAPNEPPQAYAGPDQRHEAGDLVVLDGGFSQDDDGLIVAYQWLQVSGPPVTLSNKLTVNASFSMPALLADQALVFELTVVDDRGAQSSDRVEIAAPKEVTLIANVNSGIAPLAVSFVIKTDLDAPITAYGMDYDGDGSIDEISTDPDVFEFTYTQVGSYAPYVSVLDTEGNYHLDRINIEVVSADAELAAIRTQWQALAQALINGDVDAALAYMMDYKSEEYRQLFISMGIDKLSVIFGNAAEISLQTLSDNLALCRVVRVESGGRFVYPVRFMKDTDGVWKLLRF